MVSRPICAPNMTNQKKRSYLSFKRWKKLNQMKVQCLAGIGKRTRRDLAQHNQIETIGQLVRAIGPEKGPGRIITRSLLRHVKSALVFLTSKLAVNTLAKKRSTKQTKQQVRQVEEFVPCQRLIRSWTSNHAVQLTRVHDKRLIVQTVTNVEDVFSSVLSQVPQLNQQTHLIKRILSYTVNSDFCMRSIRISVDLARLKYLVATKSKINDIELLYSWAQFDCFKALEVYKTDVAFQAMYPSIGTESAWSSRKTFGESENITRKLLEAESCKTLKLARDHITSSWPGITEELFFNDSGGQPLSMGLERPKHIEIPSRIYTSGGIIAGEDDLDLIGQALQLVKLDVIQNNLPSTSLTKIQKICSVDKPIPSMGQIRDVAENTSLVICNLTDIENWSRCAQKSLWLWRTEVLVIASADMWKHIKIGHIAQARLVIANNSIITRLDERNQSSCPLHCFRWRRVFLHTHTAQAAKFASSRYVSSLRSDFRWLVTSMLKPSTEMNDLNGVLDAVGARTQKGRRVSHSKRMLRLRSIEAIYDQIFFRIDWATLYRPTSGCDCSYCSMFQQDSELQRY